MEKWLIILRTKKQILDCLIFPILPLPTKQIDILNSIFFTCFSHFAISVGSLSYSHLIVYNKTLCQSHFSFCSSLSSFFCCGPSSCHSKYVALFKMDTSFFLIYHFWHFYYIYLIVISFFADFSYVLFMTSGIIFNNKISNITWYSFLSGEEKIPEGVKGPLNEFM